MHYYPTQQTSLHTKNIFTVLNNNLIHNTHISKESKITLSLGYVRIFPIHTPLSTKRKSEYFETKLI